MQAVILAAGESTRTRPLTLTRPKVLLKIANKTLLEHNLEQLNGLVDEVVLVLGYKKDMVMDFLEKIKNKTNLRIIWVEQKEQRGTGHALLQAEPKIKDRFVVLMGDDIYHKDSIKACLQHKYSVLADKVKNPSRFGVLIIKDNIVKDVMEKPSKPRSDLVNCGLYVLDKKIFKELKKIKKSKRGEYELTDALKSLAKKEKIYCEHVKGYWLSTGYPWDMLDANEYLLGKIKASKIRGNIEKNATLKGMILVGMGTVVKNGTYIEGPVIIGKNCTIGPNCYIRAYTCIGDNCSIGNGVEIKNCIIGDKVNIRHLSYVGDSVLGNYINIGGGTLVANLRHDNQNIKTLVNGKMVDTGKRKFGTVIGDGVHTGINTLIYPGRKIWPEKNTLPGEVVKKDII
jgi:bifunctional UDP-N-acetylglucosamine pyrophosphorylase/glucosamine-1-phosphate N-acetyltransferase